MFSKIAVNVRPAMDRRAGQNVRQSLMAIPGVKQVTIAYPNRVEVHYDSGETSASSFISVIRTHGLKTGL